MNTSLHSLESLTEVCDHDLAGLAGGAPKCDPGGVVAYVSVTVNGTTVMVPVCVYVKAAK